MTHRTPDWTTITAIAVTMAVSALLLLAACGYLRY
jgi:hypothetical protein